LGGGKDCSTGEVVGSGENLGFVGVEVDAKGGAKGLKTTDVPGKVIVAREEKRIINVGVGGRLGAEAVVARVAVMAKAVRGAGLELGVELGKEEVENKACKDGAKGTALGKTFVLQEGVGGAVRLEKEATVGVGIEEVEEREGRVECGVGSKDVAGGGPGDSIEHVGNVQKEEGTLGREGVGDWVGDKAVSEGEGGMDEVIDATLDGDTHLALGEENGGKLGGKALEKDTAGDTAVSGANAEGAEAGEVGGVFVESNKARRGKERANIGRNFVFEDEANHGPERREVRAIGRVVGRRVEGKILDDVRQVGEGAAGCTTLDLTEGREENVVGQVQLRKGTVVMGGMRARFGRQVGDLRRVKVFDESFDVWGNFGSRQGGLDAGEGGMIIVIIGGCLGGGALAVIAGKNDWAGVVSGKDLSALGI
jgi:hypothetical protein